VKAKRKEAIFAYIILAPTLIFIFVFMLGPMIQSAYYSFFKWNLLGDISFVGLKNYKFLFVDDLSFKKVILNTVIYTLFNMGGTLVLAMISALMLQSDGKIVRWVRSAVFIPVVVPMAVMGIVWNMMYEPQYGVINQALGFLGIPPQQWLFKSNTAMFSVILFNIWKEFGLYMIIIVGALQRVPRELYESASLDGAGYFRTFFKITLPSIKPIFFFVTTILMINSFKAFDHIWVMTGGGPGDATSVLVTYIYTKIYDSVGLASAASVVLFAFVFIATILQNKLSGGEE